MGNGSDLDVSRELSNGSWGCQSHSASAETAPRHPTPENPLYLEMGK